MPGLLIGDGFTLDGEVRARGPWPALKFRYRPALGEDVDHYLSESRGTAKQKTTAAAALLAKHVVSWDVLDGSGNPTPVTVANLRLLPHPYREELLNAVTGYSTEQQEADVKNSP